MSVATASRAPRCSPAPKFRASRPPIATSEFRWAPGKTAAKYDRREGLDWQACIGSILAAHVLGPPPQPALSLPPPSVGLTGVDRIDGEALSRLPESLEFNRSGISCTDRQMTISLSASPEPLDQRFDDVTILMAQQQFSSSYARMTAAKRKGRHFVEMSRGRSRVKREGDAGG